MVIDFMSFLCNRHILAVSINKGTPKKMMVFHSFLARLPSGVNMSKKRYGKNHRAFHMDKYQRTIYGHFQVRKLLLYQRVGYS